MFYVQIGKKIVSLKEEPEQIHYSKYGEKNKVLCVFKTGDTLLLSQNQPPYGIVNETWNYDVVEKKLESGVLASYGIKRAR